MTEVKRIARAFLLLNKRLLKKNGFVVILLLVPVLVAAMTLVSKEDNGLLKVMLAAEDENDTAARTIMEELRRNGEMIDFRICESPAEAESAVHRGDADAAWVFADDFADRLTAFAKEPVEKNAVVRAVEREDDPTLKMAREKLYAVVFAHYAYGLYHDYVRENVNELDKMSDDDVKSYYDSFTMNDALFEYEYFDGVQRPDGKDDSYLVSPLRGMLAAVIVLCSLAAAMFWMQDMKNGTFVWMPQRPRPLFSVGYHLTAAADAGAAVLLALFFSGIAGNFGRELFIMAVYVIALTSFCIFIRHLCGGIRVLGTVTPVLVLVILVLCPVFADLTSGKTMYVIKHLLPTTYYLESVYNLKYAWYLLAYAAALFIIDFVLYKIKEKRNKV